MSQRDVRAIAFYLPQYHPIPENDAWWGPGFTEWRNVAKARPKFPGHYQPHLPADLGFYDLRLPEVREAQADLARRYGIHGFCYYHYWFNGRRILSRPFSEVVASGEPDFPFCLCWANENWTRVWDGGSKEVLLAQNHSLEDDLAHIRALIPAFEDKRYIRIDGRPIFLVYRTELLPSPGQTAEVWRTEARRAGIGEIFLVRVESFRREIDPAAMGFDAAAEFAPTGRLGREKYRGPLGSALTKLGLLSKAYAENDVVSYRTTVQAHMDKADPVYKRFPCVSPMWDNSPRRKTDGRIVVESTPQLYEQWLRHAVSKTVHRFQGDERIVFINAWNEWAEGCHLEPDERWGHRYLEATLRALESLPDSSKARHPPREETASHLARSYWRFHGKLRELRALAGQLSLPGRYSDSRDSNRR
jgi:lipopolysaccharide biosynthesis protein